MTLNSKQKRRQAGQLLPRFQFRDMSQRKVQFGTVLIAKDML